METAQEEKTIYELFRFSVLLKGLISVAEVVAGIGILFVNPAFILHLATLLTQVPDMGPAYDFLARQVLHVAEEYTAHTAVFLSVYLLSRGLVKTFLVWALLKSKLWAYPLSLFILSLFLVYQIYQIITMHSLIVIGITIFDIVVMYFIWREYRIIQHHRQAAGQQ